MHEIQNKVEAFLFCMIVTYLVFSPIATGCSLNNGDYNITVEFVNCPEIEKTGPAEGWQEILILKLNTTWVKLMKAEANENVSSINLYADSTTLIEQYGGSISSVKPIRISHFNGVKAIGSFPDGAPAIVIEVSLDEKNLVVVTSKNEDDVLIAEQMLIQAHA